ncbi:LamB/YcsF family protein [Companilactobacillus ginsenosidimutans]|uniref:5-oxoprolinase subunit A n=1 Tax=Companilactobacillus ginsenosidimutans TaxID=1007676 RepID=A0A0H4R1A1_9LACO|nr:5-oxoprolinase subunit PxpA [Companilactobacillus ginsenosidimutans]AKP67485.1 LamB/YcsF family protein [Companilactobacillus ginsenosidimutans]
MTKIDMNSDLGESFGRYSLGRDSEIIPLVSSVNIACGYHAGDPDVMAKTVQLAEKAGVGVGAHPGFPDLQGFGRRKMDMLPEEVKNMVTYQVGALLAFTTNKKLQHVKPHGALYNMAAKDHDLAVAICEGIKQVDPELPIYGLANSELISAAKEVGIPYAQEAFGDRNYNADGTLVSRSLPNAVIKDPKEVAQRVKLMIQNEEIIALDGSKIALKPDSICVHGDNKAALAIVEELRSTLTSAGIEIKPF